MLAVIHTLKESETFGGQTTHKYFDHYQLCDTIDEARARVMLLISLHDEKLSSYAICQIIEASEPHWADASPMGLGD